MVVKARWMVPLALILLVAPVSATGAADQDEPDGCAPPCLEIYPRIGLEVDLPPEDRVASRIPDLPEVVDVHVHYRWDLKEDGTGIPGPDQTEIHLSIERTPYWLKAELSDDTCPFQPLPHQPEQEVCTVQMRLQVLGQPQSEEALDKGKRLLLMGMSDESGTFKRGYGLNDLRWTWDGPAAASATSTADGPDADAVAAGPFGALGAAAGLLLAAVAAIALRRRRRSSDPVPLK